MDENTIIIVSVFGASWLVLCILVVVLFVQVARLRRQVDRMQATGRIRVQKLKMDNDRNHAFHNPGITPDEELSKRGYSMYASDDVEGQPAPRGLERQTGGQLVDELQREIDSRHHREIESRQQREIENRQQREIENRQQREIDNRQRSSTAPPFLLQSIEENKRKRGLSQTNGRQSDTNPNFIY